MKRKTILSLDGGGLRGIIPCAVLMKIEETTGKPICELFDLVAGTSTGGLLALALTSPSATDPKWPRFSAAEVMQLYLEHGKTIFDKRNSLFNINGWLGASYGHKNFEGLLRERFGDVRIGDALTTIFITSYDIELRKPFYFSSRLATEQPSLDNFLVRDIARSTSAAPTYFEPNQMDWLATGRKLNLVDGGVFANNPAVLALVEAGVGFRKVEFEKRHAQAPPPGGGDGKGLDNPNRFEPVEPSNCLMVSLGTGNVTRKYPYSKARGWGKAQWARPIVDILMQGVSETVDFQMRNLLPTSESRIESYFRINPEIADDISAFDEVANIPELKKVADRSVRDNSAAIDRICNLLFKEMSQTA